MPVHETHLIGPPGTGKTTWLQAQVRNGLKKYSPSEILVMSFTRAAAANVAGRGTPLPRKNISTIHSFAYRLLGKPPIAEAKVSEFNATQSPEWQLTIAKVDDDMEVTRADKRTQADALFEQAQSARNALKPRDQWPDAALEWFVEIWQKWKDDNGLADFTDLLEHCLEDSAELEWETQPKVCFLDEAQDNSPLEMALVRKWSQGMHNLILCGDPDQTIYTFKGADPMAMVTTTATHNRVVLEQSYRVPRRVHAVARELILMIRNRDDAPYKPTPTEGEVAWLTAASWADPEYVIRQALESVAAGRTAMILSSCSYQIEPTRKLLRRMAVPFHNPYRRKRGDWNPLVIGGRGISAAERLWRFTIPDTSLHGPQSHPWTWTDLKAWVTPLSAEAFNKKQHTALLREAEVCLAAEKDENLPDPEPPTVAQLEQWFTPDSLEAAVEANLDWYFCSLKKSQQARFKFPYEVASKQGIKALNETPKLIIGTIHSVKGGEAEDVWLFPDISVSAHKEAVRFGPDQNIRTFYVGVTRASRKLTMTTNCEPYHMHELENVVQRHAAQP